MDFFGPGWRRFVSREATGDAADPGESQHGHLPVARNGDPTASFETEQPGPMAERATVVEAGCEIEGRLKVDKPVRIDGAFRGRIDCTASVFVSEEGSIEGPVHARSVEVRGAIVGDIVASRSVQLHASAVLHGDVETPCFEVGRGAFFNGATRMYRPELQALEAATTPQETRAQASQADASDGTRSPHP